MEEVAFGHLLWTGKDWENRDVQELYKAHRFWKKQQTINWQQTRQVCWWVARMAGKSMKRDPKLKEIMWLPGDDVVKRDKPGKKIFLNEKQIRQEYEKAGMIVTDEFVKNLMKPNA
jgi:hypothetical protein